MKNILREFTFPERGRLYIFLNPFLPEDQYRYFCKSVNPDEMARNKTAVSSGSALFAILLLFFDWNPCLQQWIVQIQEWKSPFKILRDQRVKRIAILDQTWTVASCTLQYVRLATWIIFSLDPISINHLRHNMRNRTFWHVRPTKVKSACASSQSDQSPCFPPEETLIPWLSKMRPVKILIRLLPHNLAMCRLIVRIQSNLVISNSLISNYRLSRSENLVPVLTWNYDNR